jgi:hypothetical protein
MGGTALELQKAVFAALSQDAELSALTGGARVFDRVPAHTPFPDVTFGRTSRYDWSTGTESGVEQLFSLHVWSKAQGKAETLAILERIAALLDDQPLQLDGHALVSMRLEFTEVRYDEDLAVHHGLARFRALVEVV